MTSRDLTENVEQLQVRAGARARSAIGMVTALARLAERAAEHDGLVMTGRSHNVRRPGHDAGQALRQRRRGAARRRSAGRRAARPLPAARASRARSAPSRTSSTCSAATPRRSTSSRRPWPRHLGFDAVAHQRRPGVPPLARPRRRRRAGAGGGRPGQPGHHHPPDGGHELATEGFAAGQVGSSAMPHKMNSRSCERINGLSRSCAGHLTMVGGLAGDQWNEGDVSLLGRAPGGAARRVPRRPTGCSRPLAVLDDFGAYPAVVAASSSATCPFLATTKVLMAAVRAGVGREDGPRGASRSTPWRWPWRCASRAPTATTCSTAWRPTRGSRSTGPTLDALVGEPARLRRRRAAARWPPSSPGRQRRGRRHPDAAVVPARAAAVAHYRRAA